MTSLPSIDHRIKFLFHCLGLSCVGSAIFLQILVFSNILQNGYFAAFEQNLAILTIEILLSVVGLVYFAYIYQRFMRQLKKLET
jgi:hypothetical protein